MLVMPDSIKQKHGLKERKDWVKHLPNIKDTTVRSLLINTSGQLQYSRPHIVDGHSRWSYYCRTHEYLGKSKFCMDPNAAHAQFDLIQIDHVGDGGSKSDKAPRDIVLLLMDLFDNPQSERAYFYLGNSALGAGMHEWALRCYSKAMNYCTWFEEMYISSKESIACMRALEAPWERRIAMLLHGMFQNPNRLEMLTHMIRDVRNDFDQLQRYGHLIASIAAFFTHNQFPSDQKLFIDRFDHEFGFWFELALLCYQIPFYFTLGCFAAKKAKDSVYMKEMDVQTRTFFAQQSQHLYEDYESRRKEWNTTKTFKTRSLALFLLNRAHREFSKSNYRLAKQLYQEMLQPVVSKSLLPPILVKTAVETCHEQLAKQNILFDSQSLMQTSILDQLDTPGFHTLNRFTAFMKGQSVHLMTQNNKQRPSDEEEAVACYQLALCEERLHPENKLAIAAYLMDALKVNAYYAPALAKLYDMTHMAKSQLSRAICYMIRLATFGRTRVESEHVYASVKKAVEDSNDDELDMSAYCQVRRNRSAECVRIEMKPFVRSFTFKRFFGKC
jgi:hypothetical protein